MLRRLIPLLLLPVLSASTLPDRIAEFTRGAEKPVTLADRPMWDEYGCDASAQADYTGPEGRFTLTVFRLKDTTAAMAAFLWQRPAGSQPSKFDKLAVETPKTLLLATGNYLFQYDGRRPTVVEFEELLAKLPRLENASLPTLIGFLPSANRVPNSDRYLLGPVALEKFASAVPPGAAGFSADAEAVFGKYTTPAGELSLVIFSYPTPHIARDRVLELQKIQGAVVKRSGPLVAVVPPPANADAAERLLAGVRWAANLTFNQRVPGQGEDVGTLILSIFELAGILMLLAATGGLLVGGFRVMWQKLTGHEIAREPMIMLHLEDR
jgi:hypothetical protein